MQRIFARLKRISLFWKIVLVVVVFGAANEFYENHKISTAVSQYKEVLSRTCKIAEPGLNDIYIALNSPGDNYVTVLQKVGAAEDELLSAERILRIGTSEIDGSKFSIETFRLKDNEWFLRTTIESSLNDSMDIAIAQGDPESIASGRAADGVKLVADRLETVKEICEKY